MDKASGKKPFPPKIITQFDCPDSENVKLSNIDEAQQNAEIEVHSRPSSSIYSSIFANTSRLLLPSIPTILNSPTSAHVTPSPVSSTNYSPASFSWGSRVASSTWSRSSVSSPMDFESPHSPLEPKTHWLRPAQTSVVLSGAGAQFARNSEEKEGNGGGLEPCNEFEVGDEEKFSVAKLVGSWRAMEKIPEEDLSQRGTNELEENDHSKIVTRIAISAPSELSETVTSTTESMEEVSLEEPTRTQTIQNDDCESVVSDADLDVFQDTVESLFSELRSAPFPADHGLADVVSSPPESLVQSLGLELASPEGGLEPVPSDADQYAMPEALPRAQDQGLYPSFSREPFPETLSWPLSRLQSLLLVGRGTRADGFRQASSAGWFGGIWSLLRRRRPAVQEIDLEYGIWTEMAYESEPGPKPREGSE
ncbi:hypothetical protein K440DRAFT_635586 [Wilcoxina mikolae CBS 423.85]|nr:hypothetical protein K440DRAFT_635586 [Wilcoxina mikolae CBS 423.85]